MTFTATSAKLLFMKLTNRENRFWSVVVLIGSIGILLMFISTYAVYQYAGSPDAKNSYRKNWEEYLMLPFYFTFLSNVLGVAMALVHLFNRPSFNQTLVERFKVMAATNLIITFFVYWALLSGQMNWQNAFNVTLNLFVHLITPLLTCLAFVMEARLNQDKQISIKPTVLWNLLMPLIWIIIIFALYFALGADGKEHVPYPFLDILHQKVYMTIIYIFVIGLAYAFFTALFTFIYLRKWNIKQYKSGNQLN